MEQLEVIHAALIFNTLDISDLESLLNDHNFEIVSYKKDDIIVSQNSSFKRLGIILKGKAAVLKSNINGRDTNFSVLKQSDLFGMANLFDNIPFANTIKAMNSTSVLYLDEDVFYDIIKKYPSVALAYIKLLTKKINFLTKRIDTYLTNEKSDGVYDYLIGQSELIHSNEIPLDISFSKLANMLHMSRSSLYRSFDELIAKGLITKDNKIITIIGEEK